MMDLLTFASRARNAEYLANADGTLSSHKSSAVFNVITSSNAEFKPSQDRLELGSKVSRYYE